MLTISAVRLPRPRRGPRLPARRGGVQGRRWTLFTLSAARLAVAVVSPASASSESSCGCYPTSIGSPLCDECWAPVCWRRSGRGARGRARLGGRADKGAALRRRAPPHPPSRLASPRLSLPRPSPALGAATAAGLPQASHRRAPRPARSHCARSAHASHRWAPRRPSRPAHTAPDPHARAAAGCPGRQGRAALRRIRSRKPPPLGAQASREPPSGACGSPDLRAPPPRVPVQAQIWSLHSSKRARLSSASTNDFPSPAS